mmetsp:Transcript_12700/g.31195  ORF Transcript_12700/g.31195 Transcript_12700/m.31195 type:complete len:207 (+) Transcript_12700:206-826(+)
MKSDGVLNTSKNRFKSSLPTCKVFFSKSYRKNCPAMIGVAQRHLLGRPRNSPWIPNSSIRLLNASRNEIPSSCFILLRIVSAGWDTTDAASPATAPARKDTNSWLCADSASCGNSLKTASAKESKMKNFIIPNSTWRIASGPNPWNRLAAPSSSAIRCSVAGNDGAKSGWATIRILAASAGQTPTQATIVASAPASRTRGTWNFSP